MFVNLERFFEMAQSSVVSFDAWVDRYAPVAKADHICYKCSSGAEFERLRALFERSSTFIYQSIISNRRITIVKFTQPIPTKLGNIWFLELSDQKPDNSQASGFDHIEIYPITGSMDDFASTLIAQGVTFEKVIRPHHTTYDTFIDGNFKVRLEPEALVDKIKLTEMI